MEKLRKKGDIWRNQGKKAIFGEAKAKRQYLEKPTQKANIEKTRQKGNICRNQCKKAIWRKQGKKAIFVETETKRQY